MTHSTICYTTPKQPPEGNNAVLVLHKYTSVSISIALIFCVGASAVHSEVHMTSWKIFQFLKETSWEQGI